MVIQLRLKDTPETDSFIYDVMESTDEATSSKAFIKAGREHFGNKVIISNLESKLKNFENEILRLNKIISDLDNACRATLEITGQGNLLK
jgi:hypothetical protein